MTDNKSINRTHNSISQKWTRFVIPASEPESRIKQSRPSRFHNSKLIIQHSKLLFHVFWMSFCVDSYPVSYRFDTGLCRFDGVFYPYILSQNLIYGPQTRKIATFTFFSGLERG